MKARGVTYDPNCCPEGEESLPGPRPCAASHAHCSDTISATIIAKIYFGWTLKKKIKN